MKTRSLLTLTCLLLFASTSLSQRKWKVGVDLDGEDSLGQQLAYQLREKLDKSYFFLLVPLDSDSVALVVNIVSKDAGTAAGGESVCSVAYTAQSPKPPNMYFCFASVYLFGKSQVDSIATDIVGSILIACQVYVDSKMKTKE